MTCCKTTTIVGAAVLGVLATPTWSASIMDGVGFSLGGDGSTLIRIEDLTDPATSQRKPIVLPDGTLLSLDALAYRPETTETFGYSDAAETVYNLDLASGVARPVISGGGMNAAGQTIETTAPTIGFDFNNQVDAARIVSVNGENLVFFPISEAEGRTTTDINRFTDLFYEAGDPNEGRTPNIFANAYTNAVPDPSSTFQYVLDSDNDTLSFLGNNAGNLVTIGQLTVGGTPLDFGDTGGFDILSEAEGDNTAFLLLDVDGQSGLYTFDFAPGEAMLSLGDIEVDFLGATEAGIEGLSVAARTDVAPIPVPASLPLLGGGLVIMGIVARRKRKAA